jgi:hypothetical protein
MERNNGGLEPLKQDDSWVLGDDGEVEMASDAFSGMSVSDQLLDAAKQRLKVSESYQDRMRELIDKISNKERESPVRMWMRINRRNEEDYGLVCILPKLEYKGKTDKLIYSNYGADFLMMCPDGFFKIRFSEVWLDDNDKDKVQDPFAGEWYVVTDDPHVEGALFLKRMKKEESKYFSYNVASDLRGEPFTYLSSNDEKDKSIAAASIVRELSPEEAGKWYQEINEMVAEKINQRAAKLEGIADTADELLGNGRKEKRKVSLEELTGDEGTRNVWVQSWLAIKEWLSSFKK